jgi:hypothetical protein
LISVLTEFPEFIIVCEKDENGSQLRRLDKVSLRDWQAKLNWVNSVV